MNDEPRKRLHRLIARGSRRSSSLSFYSGCCGFVYYIAGNQIPGISDLGDWNILIGMGLMAAGFGVATLWK